VAFAFKDDRQLLSITNSRMERDARLGRLRVYSNNNDDEA
jgi:hypothetical protein